MLFNSIEYLFIFLPIVFILYFVLNHIKFYNGAKIFLLLASLFFYGSYKIEYVPIILVSIILNYFISFLFKKDLTKQLKKIILIGGISTNILILIFFKYFNFVIDTFRDFNITDFSAFKVILPLGISFFTLQEISYIVDCYREKVSNYNLLDYALFVCFFPQLVAGPIVRHQEMIPQFNKIENRKINQNNIFVAIFLITVGLLKKTVFADNFASFTDYVIQNQMYSDFYISWLTCITKTLQLYFDFSAYCDLAMGSAFLFNINIPWNFNSPYKAQSIIEFWKKWNMTFVRFLKDYIYKPLGEDKKGVLTTLRNIFVVFLCIGIWGSTNLTNIFYGILNGIFVCINKFWSKLNIKMNKILATAITFLSIMITVQFTFVKNFGEAYSLMKSMLGVNAEFHGVMFENFNMIFLLPPPHNAQINIIILILGLLTVFFFKNSSELARIYVKSNNMFYTFILTVVFIFAALSITKSTDFIYFIF